MKLTNKLIVNKTNEQNRTVSVSDSSRCFSAGSQKRRRRTEEERWESREGSLFFRLLLGRFQPHQRTVKRDFRAAESLSGHRGPVPLTTGFISCSSPGFSPLFPWLLLLSSGHGATRLTANREGLPPETEKEERGKGVGGN